MNKIKKEIKLLYTFIILFIVCAFLLLFNILLVLSKPLNQANSKDFEKTSNSVVSIHTYTGNKKTKQGSGFIYKVEKDKAYILTNNHVVDEKANLKVFVTEEKSVKATLVGRDKYLDIAVLTIENNNYKALKLNRKNNYNIGDTVYTIGTPLNNEFFNSVSSGIISKTNRLRYEKNDNEDILMDLIQTDIIINPGNSGCPLFNSKLEVIGIYTSIIETENISAISFAVPITQVINKLDELEKKEKATERKISNLEVVDVKDSEVLYKNDLIDITKESYGVVVIKDDEKYSLKKGDIIIKINDKKVKDIDHYNLYLNHYSEGEKVSLKIKRNNIEKTIKVTLK